MSAPDISPCPCCASRLAPVLTDSAQGVGLFSLGVWVACPTCEMAGPHTWICFESAEVERELADAQADAVRAWNRIAAAVSTLTHLTQEVA